jgi:hypothetical protein
VADQVDSEGRRILEVPVPSEGWRQPWPNVAELERLLPCQHWTLIGGLMVQLHTIYQGLDVIRPTADVDLLVHVETPLGRTAQAADALETLGYRLQVPLNARTPTAHRWLRGVDTVDVVAADHAPPSVRQRLRGYQMVTVEGGTQALRRTVIAALSIEPGGVTRISVPSAFGALVMKAVAHQVDSRDRDRHLLDAVALLACLEDPLSDRATYVGSDRKRLDHLARALADQGDEVWLSLPSGPRQQARAALQLLTAQP